MEYSNARRWGKFLEIFIFLIKRARPKLTLKLTPGSEEGTVNVGE